MGAATIADTLSVKIHIGGVDGNEAVSSVSSLLPPGLLPDASQGNTLPIEGGGLLGLAVLSCVRTRPNAESELLTQLGINGSLPLPSLEEFVTGGLVALLASQTNLTSTALNALKALGLPAEAAAQGDVVTAETERVVQGGDVARRQLVGGIGRDRDMNLRIHVLEVDGGGCGAVPKGQDREDRFDGARPAETMAMEIGAMEPVLAHETKPHQKWGTDRKSWGPWPSRSRISVAPTLPRDGKNDVGTGDKRSVTR